MKRILINATQTEELRVAMVSGQRLYDLDIESPSREQKKSNIYKGKITRVEPSLEAAFVNYGANRHGFLPFKEISEQYYREGVTAESGKINIKDAIKVDQEIIVQIEKEERSNKGAALTSFISLAGRFLVAMPQNPRAGGVSRRIDGEDRDELRKVLSTLTIPENMGVIVRTAGVGRSSEELQWDLDYLNQVWVAIEDSANKKPAPFLIYKESDIVVRALRDHYRADIGEIIIDSEQAYQEAHDFMSMVMPGTLSKLKQFDEDIPLFNRFQIESQIESAFSREVTLPSGGSIVIDHTEAMISIDVNSARATKGSDIEETARQTNVEAADEIARQLRIRDLGGLIVIDFIDMTQSKNRNEVESVLRSSIYDDRARVQTSRISRFGLLEMSRQRLRPSLGESSQIVCPRCMGQGSIRDIESLSLAVLRLLEEEALKNNTGKILAKMPVECATYLLNEKRDKIDDVESQRKLKIVIIPDPNLETPNYQIERVKDNDTHRHESNYKKSYELTTNEDAVDLVGIATHTPQQGEVASVQRIKPPAPRPQKKSTKSGPGLFRKILNILFGDPDNKKTQASQKSAQQNRNSRGTQNHSRRGKYRGSQNRNRNSSNSNNTNSKSATEAASSNQATSEKANTRNQPQKTANKETASRSENRPQRSRNNRSTHQKSHANHSNSNNSNDNSSSSSVSSNKSTDAERPISSDNPTNNTPESTHSKKQSSAVKSENNKVEHNYPETKAKRTAPPIPPRANAPKDDSAPAPKVASSAVTDVPVAKQEAPTKAKETSESA